MTIRRTAAALCILLIAVSAGAQKQPEDFAGVICHDDIDNDFDGPKDCSEETCRSSDERCGRLLPGPIAVGLGADRPPITFDVPMITRGGPPPASGLLVVDIDGAGPNRDDLIAGRRAIAALFLNLPTPGKLSLPLEPATIDTVSGSLRFAGGDLNNDGRADFVAVNEAGIHHFFGDGRGGFTRSQIRAIAPDSARGVPAIIGPTVAVAKTRLRLYDARCRTKPVGFPDGETFNADDLCASADLPGSEAASRAIAFRSSNDREYVAAVNDRRTVSLFEIVVTRRVVLNTTMLAVDAVLRSTFTAEEGVNDLAFTADGDVLVFALNDGKLQAVLVSAIGEMASSPRFPTIALVPQATERDPFTHIVIGPLIGGRPTAAVTETKTANLYVLPFSAAAGWDRRELVPTSFKGDLDEPRAAGVVMAELNGDGLLDVAVLDGKSGKVVILRQQPQPCATYITSASHGLMPTASLEDTPLADSADPTYTPLSRFNHLLAHEVEKINAERRPADGFRDNPDAKLAICPIRFIDVRGHWEKLSGEGSLIAYGGRGAWLVSMYIPAPICWFPLPALPAATPVDYWLSLPYLFIPNPPGNPDPVCVADLPIPSDPGTRMRFLLGGFGFGLELIARDTTSKGSRKAAGKLNGRLREAIEDADKGMDKCTGQIFVDLIGHSRGTAVVTETLRRGFGPRSNFNFEVSTTLLDAVDPSPGDNVRPWIHAGYIVGDPVITRVGSEWNSAFWCNDSSGSPLDGLIFAVPPLTPPQPDVDEFKRAEIVGLPKGRERQRELEKSRRSFGSYAGPLGVLRHGDFAGDKFKDGPGIGFLWVDPDDESTNHLRESSSEVNSARFNFTSTSHLGLLLQDPRAGMTSAGFHRSTDFSESDEEHCLPDECGRVAGDCKDVIDDKDGVEAARRDSDGIVTRELVSDFDFRIEGGLVRNAIEIITDEPLLKKLTADTHTGGLYKLITTTARTEWAETGAWRRSGDVRLITRPEKIAPAVERLTGRRTDKAAWQEELFGAATTPASQLDATMALSHAIARMNAPAATAVVARYPPASASLSAELRAASITYPQLYVRVEYMLRSQPTGTVNVSLQGPGVLSRESWTAADGTGRRVGELLVNRTGVFREGADTIRVEGKDVDVFSVSVRPFQPYRSRVSGADYEFVTLDYGVTQETARALSARSAFHGRSGRLARIDSRALQQELEAKVSPDTAAWTEGARFDQTLPSVTLRGKRFGFWIEYPVQR